MATKDKFYGIPIPPLNFILRVKKLNKQQQKKIFDSICKIVSEYKADTTLSKYILNLMSNVVVPESFSAFDVIIKKTDDMQTKIEVLMFVYSSIIDIYPIYNLEFVLQKLNGIKPTSRDDIPTLDDLNRFLLDRGTVFVTENLDKEDKKKPTKKKDEDLKPYLNVKQVKEIEKYLKANIIGQDKAIESLINSLTLICAGLETRASFFFVGPTGVGKSQLAKLFGEKYCGNFLVINCAEFSHGHEMAKLIGAPPGFVGHSEKPLLKEKADKSNRWVFLFDEIEKAHDKFFNFLLSLLDTGMLQDSSGNNLDFTNSIFIFTSNKGLTDIKTEFLGFSGKDLLNTKPLADNEIIKKAINSQFSPEFRNRLDEFIYFNELSLEDVKRIVCLNLEKLPVFMDDELVDYIIKNAFSREYGVREIKRFIKRNVALPIANCIIAGIEPKSSYYTCKVREDKVIVCDAADFANLC